MSILIYQSEIEAGISDMIAKASAVSYCSKLEKSEFTSEQKEAIYRSVAELKMKDYNIQVDGLYPAKSILVSTVWNLNDDIFDKYETFLARNTPLDKPANLDHKESVIVGHITGNIVIDGAGNVIPDDISADELPDLFHIFNTSVIYACFSEPDLIERAAKLIAEVEAGEKYVSMECLFRGFDYGVRTPDGVYKTVERNKSTAFLSKHLRAYGGPGQYEGHKIGRILRGITFSGKGFVDRPANPASIVFDKDTVLDFVSKAHLKEFQIGNGVYLNHTANNGDQEIMSAELETKVTELTTANTDLSTKLEAGKAEVVNLTTKLDEATKANTDLTTQITSLTTANETLKTENTELKTKISAFELEQVKAKRLAKFVEAGYTKEDAEKKLETFASLNDEQFETVTAELISVKKSAAEWEDMKKKKEDEEKKKKDADASALENVEAEVVITPPVVDTSAAKVREGLAALLKSAVSPTKKKTVKKS